MSRQIAQGVLRVLGLCLIEVLATAASAQQSQSGQKTDAEIRTNHFGPSASSATASIPFEFWIGPEKMPAGDYILQTVVPSVAIIRSADGKLERELFMVDIGAPVSANESKLIFVVRNGKYMLWELWSVYGKRRLSAEDTLNPRQGEMTTVVDMAYH